MSTLKTQWSLRRKIEKSNIEYRGRPHAHCVKPAPTKRLAIMGSLVLKSVDPPGGHTRRYNIYIHGFRDVSYSLATCREQHSGRFKQLEGKDSPASYHHEYRRACAKRALCCWGQGRDRTGQETGSWCRVPCWKSATRYIQTIVPFRFFLSHFRERLTLTALRSYHEVRLWCGTVTRQYIYLLCICRRWCTCKD